MHSERVISTSIKLQIGKVTVIAEDFVTCCFSNAETTSWMIYYPLVTLTTFYDFMNPSKYIYGISSLLFATLLEWWELVNTRRCLFCFENKIIPPTLDNLIYSIGSDRGTVRGNKEKQSALSRTKIRARPLTQAVVRAFPARGLLSSNLTLSLGYH